MPTKKSTTPTLNTSLVDLELCVAALRSVAHTDAGHSQGSDSFTAESTDEWKLAKKLQERIDRKRLSVAKSYTLNVNLTDIALCIQVLQSVAHTNAAHSQDSSYFTVDATAEWQLAQRLQMRIDKKNGVIDEDIIVPTRTDPLVTDNLGNWPAKSTATFEPR